MDFLKIPENIISADSKTAFFHLLTRGQPFYSPLNIGPFFRNLKIGQKTRLLKYSQVIHHLIRF